MFFLNLKRLLFIFQFVLIKGLKTLTMRACKCQFFTSSSTLMMVSCYQVSSGLSTLFPGTAAILRSSSNAHFKAAPSIISMLPCVPNPGIFQSSKIEKTRSLRYIKQTNLPKQSRGQKYILRWKRTKSIIFWHFYKAFSNFGLFSHN